MVFAMVTAKPNAISATASSSATTESSVSVTGPLALYCLMTMMVAAGAVADAIAPSTSEKGRSWPLMTSPSTTISTAPRPSVMAITTGVKPMRLK